MKEKKSCKPKGSENNEKKKRVVIKAVSLKNCTYQRNFGLTQCGSAI